VFQQIHTRLIRKDPYLFTHAAVLVPHHRYNYFFKIIQIEFRATAIFQKIIHSNILLPLVILPPRG
jgi:hypothetical protein